MKIKPYLIRTTDPNRIEGVGFCITPGQPYRNEVGAAFRLGVGVWTFGLPRIWLNWGFFYLRNAARSLNEARITRFAPYRKSSFVFGLRCIKWFFEMFMSPPFTIER
jgi:hypothetical protein